MSPPTRSAATCASSQTPALLRRVHGGALPAAVGARPYAVRREQAPAAKEAIAHATRSLLRQGQVILLDAGTTTLEVARRLPPDLEATVITNSPPIAVALAEHPAVEVTMLGGSLAKDAQAVVGAATVEALHSVRADVLVLGVCSLHPEVGITVMDLEESYVKRAMIENAAEVVAVSSAEKLGSAGHYVVAPLDELTHLVTDAVGPGGHSHAVPDAWDRGGAGVIRSPRAAITLVFLADGLLVGTWAARIPAVQRHADVTTGQLGLALFAASLGALLAMPSAGRLTERIGSRPVTIVALVGGGLALLLTSIAGDLVGLAAALFLFGAGFGGVNVAANAQGLALERLRERSILSSFHAAFSFGGLAGAGLGALAAARGIDPVEHFSGPRPSRSDSSPSSPGTSPPPAGFRRSRTDAAGTHSTPDGDQTYVSGTSFVSAAVRRSQVQNTTRRPSSETSCTCPL